MGDRRMVGNAAEQLGGLHILVNSGSSPGGSATATGPIDTVVDEDLIQDFNVKYVGALRCCRAVIPFRGHQTICSKSHAKQEGERVAR
jgi:NAD(P)-dependent dehydrogenase (short-subunit alcohol dehydrogenase family)